MAVDTAILVHRGCAWNRREVSPDHSGESEFLAMINQIATHQSDDPHVANGVSWRAPGTMHAPSEQSFVRHPLPCAFQIIPNWSTLIGSATASSIAGFVIVVVVNAVQHQRAFFDAFRDVLL